MMGCSADAGGEDAIHVALGRDFKKGKVILDWVFKNLRSTEVVIVHAHKPPKLIPMKMGGNFPIHMAAPEEAEIHIEAKRAKMDALVHSYMHLCARHEICAKKLVIETEDVFKGIVYLVGQHQIKRLVMGLRSIKDQPVLEEGLLCCQIWLVHNGKLVLSRQALLQQISIEFTGDENRGNSTFSPKIAKETSSPKSAKEASSTSSAKETSSTSSAKETSSPKSAKETSSTESGKEISSPKSAKETSASHESHQEYGARETSGRWLMKSVEESEGHCSKVEETEVGSSSENFEAEDFRDLLVKLVEAVHVVYQQRLDLARQMLVLKQEFIEFSLPELEEATDRLITKKPE